MTQASGAKHQQAMMQSHGRLLVNKQMSFQLNEDETISSEPLKKEKAEIRPVSYQMAMDMVVENHYLHRTAPVSHAFGLFLPNFLEPLGVVTYGVPVSSTLIRGICGDEHKHNVYELNRLWIDDRMGKNSESYLVGNSLRLLDREIIVSYADTKQNHLGIIYQACNFYYTGLSSKFKDPKIQGIEGHHATYAHGMTNDEVVERFGDRVQFIERSRKHRYIFFNARGKRKKELLASLKYKVQPYPKQQIKQEREK
jgi:hypothetical protein